MHADFDLRCRDDCRTPVTDWVCVEAGHGVGIWHAVCGGCGRAWTVQVER